MSAPNPTTDYLFLFRGEHWDKGLSPEELQQIMDKVTAWFEGLQQQGKVKASQPLGPVGRTVSGKGRTVSDGPFTESKEVVGGYLLLQADDLDAAVAIAKSCPSVDYGITIEVRPVLEECPIFERARARMALATA
jgi:hypothetical protein